MASAQPLLTEKNRLSSEFSSKDDVNFALPKGAKAESSQIATMCKIALPRTLRNPVLHKKTQLTRTNDWMPSTSDCFYLRTLEAESGGLYDGPDFTMEQVCMNRQPKYYFCKHPIE